MTTCLTITTLRYELRFSLSLVHTHTKLLENQPKQYIMSFVLSLANKQTKEKFDTSTLYA